MKTYDKKNEKTDFYFSLKKNRKTCLITKNYKIVLSS